MRRLCAKSSCLDDAPGPVLHPDVKADFGESLPANTFDFKFAWGHAKDADVCNLLGRAGDSQWSNMLSSLFALKLA